MANEMTIKLADSIKKAKSNMWGREFSCELERNFFFAEQLIESGVIVPPCKVGDTVYWLLNGKANECTVHCISQEYYDDEITLRLHIRGKWCEIDLQPIYPFPDPVLFFIKEEAEKALKARANNVKSD